MCDERERLIDFLYDEGDPRQNAEVQAHLNECATCRTEIGALRAVRQDLMAWATPTPAPVWRPLAPERPAPTWSDVPPWVLAAAAAVVLMAGASGAVATRLLTGAARPLVTATSRAAVEPRAVPAATSTAAELASSPVTVADLARLEERFRLLEAGMTHQIGILASHQSARTTNTALSSKADAVLQDLQNRLARTEAQVARQVELNTGFNNRINTVFKAMRSSDDPMIIRTGFGSSR